MNTPMTWRQYHGKRCVIDSAYIAVAVARRAREGNPAPGWCQRLLVRLHRVFSR